MKNFTRYFIGLILFFNSFVYADYATTKRITVSDIAQGTVTRENYIKDSPPKAGVTKGWTCYSDTAGSVPVDGTGGSPTGVTWTATNTTPLKGPGAFVLTKSGAADKRGMGCSYNFTIDKQDQAKVLGIEAEYIVDSGTFTAGTPTTNSDVIFYVYDVTNAKLIEPSSIKLLSNSTTISDAYRGTFQSNPDSVSYRLIAHISNTTTNDFALKFGGISVSRSSYPTGTPITDMVSAPTVALSSGTNVSLSQHFQRREGDHIRQRGLITWNGAGAGGTFTVSLGGYTIDTNKINSSTQNTIEGYAMWLDNGTARKAVGVTYNSTTGIQFEELTSSAGVLVGTGFASGDVLSYEIVVPIVGLSSSVQMSDSADTRIVLSTSQIAASATTTNGGIVQFNTVTKDTHGSITTGASWKHTVVVAGDYRVSINMDVNIAANYQVYLNGVSQGYILSAPSSLYGFGQRTLPNLKAGDYIHFVSDTGGTVQAASYCTIERISGPSAIAANESVNLSYSSSTTGSIGTSATLQSFATKAYDTHGAWSGSVFTAPIAGKYQIAANVLTAAVTLSATQELVLLVYKNGSSYRRLDTTLGNGSGVSYSAQGITTVDLLAGETLSIYASSAVATTQQGSGTFTFVSIERIGN